MVRDLEVLHREPAEGGVAHGHAGGEADTLARNSRLDLARRCVSDDHSAVDDDNTPRQLVRLLEIVRGEHDRLSGCGERAYAVEHSATTLHGRDEVRIVV